jgi:hypothetical protein
MKLLKFSIPVLVIGLGFSFSAATSFAKVEYSKKEKKSCTFCHVKMGSKDLNEAGKYYKEHNHSLEGFKS